MPQSGIENATAIMSIENYSPPYPSPFVFSLSLFLSLVLPGPIRDLNINQSMQFLAIDFKCWSCDDSCNSCTWICYYVLFLKVGSFVLGRWQERYEAKIKREKKEERGKRRRNAECVGLFVCKEFGIIEVLAGAKTCR